METPRTGPPRDGGGSSKDFLFEIGTEEIPAGYLPPARDELRARLVSWLAESGLEHGEVRAWATPRRLAALVAGLGERQPDRERQVVGPPVRAAYDAEGKPTKALTGFAGTQGVAVEALLRVETPRGEYLAARVVDKGRDVRELLIETLPLVVASLPFPKSMRWEPSGFRFARPIRWLLALYGEETVPVEIAGLRAGRVTWGHRALSHGPIEVRRPDEWLERLREAGVVARDEERRELVTEGARRCAAEAGGRPREDEGLVTTVSYLVERPLPVLARFDPQHLDLPPEVIVTALREHQRYFAVEDGSGALLPCFVVVGNGAPGIEEAVRRGGEKVVAARLADARFYWQEDRRRPFADRVSDLDRVVWQEELGTMGEKARRVGALAGHIARELEPAAAEAAARAGLLSKADLTTVMIKDGKEFTSLQGIMGEAYARASGEPDEVARAIYEHLLPRFAGDALPKTAAGAVASMADKLDTLVGCLAVGLGPTGAGDPFGLRRQAQGVVSIVAERGYDVALDPLVDRAIEGFGDKLAAGRAEHRAATLEFLAQRVAFLLEGEGQGGEVARAVLAVCPTRPVEARRRARTLAEFRGDADFTALALGFKRVRNILKGVKETPALDSTLFAEPAEKRLASEAAAAAAEVGPLLAAGRHREALQRMVALRPAIDAFFESVLVMDKDERVKGNRLALLKNLSALFLQFADFSLMAITGETPGAA